MRLLLCFQRAYICEYKRPCRLDGSCCGAGPIRAAILCCGAMAETDTRNSSSDHGSRPCISLRASPAASVLSEHQHSHKITLGAMGGGIYALYCTPHTALLEFDSLTGMVGRPLAAAHITRGALAGRWDGAQDTHWHLHIDGTTNAKPESCRT